MKAYVTPDFKKLLVSKFAVPCAVESMNIGFLFSKTVLVLAKLLFNSVPIELFTIFVVILNQKD